MFYNHFKQELTSLILTEVFEFGIDNKVDMYIRDKLNNKDLENHLSRWLCRIYLENQFASIHDVNELKILEGLLMTVSRLDVMHIDMYPEYELIALCAIHHPDKMIVDYGVRCYENWGKASYIQILKSIEFSPKWLQEYVDQVIIDLGKENK